MAASQSGEQRQQAGHRPPGSQHETAVRWTHHESPGRRRDLAGTATGAETTSAVDPPAPGVRTEAPATDRSPPPTCSRRRPHSRPPRSQVGRPLLSLSAVYCQPAGGNPPC
jgi:hypothetical protein